MGTSKERRSSVQGGLGAGGILEKEEFTTKVAKRSIEVDGKGGEDDVRGVKESKDGFVT
jgi:hypothetical protein